MYQYFNVIIITIVIIIYVKISYLLLYLILYMLFMVKMSIRCFNNRRKFVHISYFLLP